MRDDLKLINAVNRLREKWEELKLSGSRRELQPSDIDSIKESVIHRFEICHDMLWKHLKKFLQEDTGLSEIPNSPNAIFRIAAEHSFIPHFATWHAYTMHRNNTSHDYDGKKAEDTLEIIGEYIFDVVKLTERITKTNL